MVLEADHKICQLPKGEGGFFAMLKLADKGGGGVWQMLALADKGGRKGGVANANITDKNLQKYSLTN